MCIWSVLFYVEPFNKFKRNVDIVCLLSNEHTLLLKTANKIHWENNSRYEFSGEILFYMSLFHPSSFFVLFNSSMLVFVNPGFFCFLCFFWCMLCVCWIFVTFTVVLGRQKLRTRVRSYSKILSRTRIHQTEIRWRTSFLAVSSIPAFWRTPVMKKCVHLVQLYNFRKTK